MMSAVIRGANISSGRPVIEDGKTKPSLGQADAGRDTEPLLESAWQSRDGVVQHPTQRAGMFDDCSLGRIQTVGVFPPLSRGL